MIDKVQILEMIKNSVHKTEPTSTVILYGSHARGDNKEDSDIDILILIDKEKVTQEDRIRITYPLYDIQFEMGVLICPVVFPKKSWETKYRITPFYNNVTKEGIRL